MAGTTFSIATRALQATGQATGLALALLAFPGIAGAEGGIKVVINQAKIVKLSQPADTIVIGNPEIADASVQDAKTIVLTGKGFGVTNIVVLNAEGEPIVDEQLIVARQEASSVRIYRRANVQTLSCTPNCESAYKTGAEQKSEDELNGG